MTRRLKVAARSFGRFVHGGEELTTDHGDGSVVGELDTVFEGLGADDAVLAGEEQESTEACAFGLLFVPFGQVSLSVYGDLALDVCLTLQSLALCQHQLLVFIYSFLNNAFKHVNIGFTTPEGDFLLVELDKSLDEEILHESLVDLGLFAHLLVKGHLCSFEEVLDHLLDADHSLNSFLVLFSRLGNLQPDFLIVELVGEVLSETLLLRLNMLLLANVEVVVGLLLDFLDAFLAGLFDERHHGVEDDACLVIVHI